MKTIRRLEDLTPDAANANAGTERGTALLDTLLATVGAGRGVAVDADGVIVAGNSAVELGVAHGLKARVVRTEGDVLVVGQRMDLDLATDPQARALAYGDNTAPQLGLHWNAAQVATDAAAGLIPAGFWTGVELEALIATAPGTGPTASVWFETAADLATWTAFAARFATPEAFDTWVSAQIAAAGPAGGTFGEGDG